MESSLKSTLPAGRFVHVEARHSRTMRAIKSRGAKTTEVALAMAFVRAGVKGWKSQPQGLLANPDFYFPARKLAIFVDGCFWHGCPKCGHIPNANRSFWSLKLELNKARDKRNNRRLRKAGIQVFRIWEHQLTSTSIQRRLKHLLRMLQISIPSRSNAKSPRHHLPPRGVASSNNFAHPRAQQRKPKAQNSSTARLGPGQTQPGKVRGRP
jgi:DNA mismatch endonuclease, patch repair protein